MSAGDTIQGQRVYDLEPHEFEEGDYGLWEGRWFCRAPSPVGRPDLYFTGNLGNHQVAEHEDGTITVSPSILIGPGAIGREGPTWHGYLERGVWREV